MKQIGKLKKESRLSLRKKFEAFHVSGTGRMFSDHNERLRLMQLRISNLNKQSQKAPGHLFRTRTKVYLTNNYHLRYSKPPRLDAPHWHPERLYGTISFN